MSLPERAAGEHFEAGARGGSPQTDVYLLGAVLYRVVESIGRWSMIDIFMISILVGLVRLGSIATIEPGVGATSFAAVVIITRYARSVLRV